MGVSSTWGITGSKHGDKARYLRSLARSRPLPVTLRVPVDAWQFEGACVPAADASVSARAALFEAFDEPTASVERLAMVRGVCGSCPVLAECRRFAMASDGPEYGALAGLTPEERKARRAGDGRSHEQLAAEGWRVGGGAQRAGRSRGKTAHGGVRRGVGWSTVAGAVVDVMPAVDVTAGSMVELEPVDLEAPSVAVPVRSEAVSRRVVPEIRDGVAALSRRRPGRARVLVRGDVSGRWLAVAVRFAAAGSVAPPTVCCAAALPRRVSTRMAVRA